MPFINIESRTLKRSSLFKVWSLKSNHRLWNSCSDTSIRSWRWLKGEITRGTSMRTWVWIPARTCKAGCGLWPQSCQGAGRRTAGPCWLMDSLQDTPTQRSYDEGQSSTPDILLCPPGAQALSAPHTHSHTPTYIHSKTKDTHQRVFIIAKFFRTIHVFSSKKIEV